MTDDVLARLADWGRRAVSRVAPVLQLMRQPRDWLYLAYGAAAIQRLDWQPENPEGISLLVGLLLPATALTIARLTQREWLHRWGGGALLALALLRVAAGGASSGSRRPDREREASGAPTPDVYRKQGKPRFSNMPVACRLVSTSTRPRLPSSST